VGDSAKRIIVIGGGVGGLTCAWRLHQALPTAQITVLEAAPQTGGVLRTRSDEGLILELGPDSIIRAKPAAVELIRDLGLDERLQETDPAARSSLIARGGRLLPVPEGLYLLAPGRIWPFVWSRVISWRGKLRMLKDLVIPPATLDDETLGAFVRRRLGREALDRLAQPLVSGIYTADPEKLSLAATMPQFLAMERTHGSLLLAMRRRMRDQATASASGPRYGLFVSLRGGLQVLVDALAERLRTAGVELRTATPALGVVREDGVWQVATAGGVLAADAVVVAGPAWAAAALLRDADTTLSDKLAGIAYAGVATINLTWRREQIPALPAAAGFVVPAVEGRSLVACTFSNRKYAGRSPDHLVSVRAFVGGALHAHHLDRDDATLVAAVLADLKDLLHITAAPERVTVTRWPRAMAQYHLGHLERVAIIRAREAALGTLALVGNGYEGVGIPDVVAQANAAAQRLVSAFAPGPC
jgi:oxygen-dependent protoporphyrinogen oxidase